MSIRNMDDSELKNYKVENGVIVTDVKNYGKAFNQRIGKGLVITSADKKNIETVAELKKIFEDKKGKAVLLKIVDSQGQSRLVGLEIPK